MKEKELRDCFSLFTTGVIISTTNFAGQNYGMTINSFASVSLDPALLLFSIDSKSSNLNAFQKGEHFSLSILSNKQLNLAQEFARPANEQKWKVEEHFLDKTNAPIFKNSLGYFECEKHDIIAAGDHHIIIGKIINHSKLSDDQPLLYLNSRFHSL